VSNNPKLIKIKPLNILTKRGESNELSVFQASMDRFVTCAYLNYAALIIAIKESALRQAPPTNAPSTSCFESNSDALSGFTLPPY